MQVQLIFGKMGKCQGCRFELQERVKDPCLHCERNPRWAQLQDLFQERDKPVLPSLSSSEPPNPNDALLGEWGLKKKRT